MKRIVKPQGSAIMSSHNQFEQREWVVLENQGQRIFAVLHTPLHANGKFPAVLFCHGFAGNKIGAGRMYVALAETLAKEGIAALRMDFRCCGDSEGQFSEMNLPGLISDAEVALRHLAGHSAVDSSKIGILGSSLGGPIAVYASRSTAIPSTMALWAPVASGQRWREDWERHHSHENIEGRIRSGGQSASAEFCEQFLAMTADKEMAQMHGIPLLHVHGNCDVTVFPQHAEDYRRAREEARAASHFIILPNSDHNFSIEEERELMLAETVQWFKKTLLA